MCEYCGCQTIEAIAELTREHDELRTVAREATDAARTADRAAATRAAARLLTLLRPHTEIEERGLFPAMAREFDAHVASLRDDHRRLEDTLSGVVAGPDDTGWPARLDAAVSELFGHILREQDGLFPASLSVLSAHDWDELDRIRAQVLARAPAGP